MRVNIREIVLTAAVVLWPIAAIGQESIAIKSFTVFMGQCRLQIIVGFFPCDGRVIYTELKNGRSMVTFTKANAMFTVSGGTDRQPDLEDYYVGIDTIRLHQENGEEAEDHGMGGECHFRMNESASKFFDIKCNVYNRAKGSYYSFFLEKITKFNRKVF